MTALLETMATRRVGLEMHTPVWIAAHANPRRVPLFGVSGTRTDLVCGCRRGGNWRDALNLNDGATSSSPWLFFFLYPWLLGIFYCSQWAAWYSLGALKRTSLAEYRFLTRYFQAWVSEPDQPSGAVAAQGTNTLTLRDAKCLPGLSPYLSIQLFWKPSHRHLGFQTNTTSVVSMRTALHLRSENILRTAGYSSKVLYQDTLLHHHASDCCRRRSRSSYGRKRSFCPHHMVNHRVSAVN